MPQTQWVDDPDALDALVADISNEPRYALDTEFHGERSYFPKLALVQIGWRDQIALVDPLAVDPAPLGALLRGRGLMVAHAGDQDLAILERACGAIPSRYFDTQVAAGFCGLGTPALTRLADQLLGVRLAKGDRLTDWTRRPLRSGQAEYAASDVEHLLALHDELTARIEKSDRSAWLEAELAERLARDRSPQNPDLAWWKIKGARSMRGDTRRVAQAVAAWRERTAQTRDLPARFVLSDLALAGIVHRAPTDDTELRAVRGLDGRGLKPDVAQEILDAVHVGLALDDSEIRAPQQAPSADRRLAPAVSIIGAWLSERASEMKLESSLLGTRADVTELIVRGRGRLTEGWRAEIAGEPIRALLAGEACVVLADGGTRLVLEDRTSDRTAQTPR